MNGVARADALLYGLSCQKLHFPGKVLSQPIKALAAWAIGSAALEPSRSEDMGRALMRRVGLYPLRLRHLRKDAHTDLTASQQKRVSSPHSLATQQAPGVARLWPDSGVAHVRYVYVYVCAATEILQCPKFDRWQQIEEDERSASQIFSTVRKYAGAVINYYVDMRS